MINTLPVQLRLLDMVAERARVLSEKGIRETLDDTTAEVSQMRFRQLGVKNTLGILTLELHATNIWPTTRPPAGAVFHGGFEVHISSSLNLVRLRQGIPSAQKSI